MRLLRQSDCGVYWVLAINNSTIFPQRNNAQTGKKRTSKCVSSVTKIVYNKLTRLGFSRIVSCKQGSTQTSLRSWFAAISIITNRNTNSRRNRMRNVASLWTKLFRYQLAIPVGNTRTRFSHLPFGLTSMRTFIRIDRRANTWTS